MRDKVTGELTESFSAFREVFRTPIFVGSRWRGPRLSWAIRVFVAIKVYAFTAGGATAVGVVTVTRLVPAAIAAPFTAILGDRYPRKWVMFVSNIGQSIAVGAAGVVILADGA